MRLKFGPPGAGSGGWPVFDKDGKRIRETEPTEDEEVQDEVQGR